MRPDYTEDFYEARRKGAQKSAKAIVPLVLELIQPRSVIDVGCGSGSWLSVFKECGVSDVLGLDGDYVDRGMLEIPEEQFLAVDLTNPLKIDRQFDLVVSLEVAEHLPRKYARTLVNSLTRLGPVILFSAAIPFQEGTNHLNEQWPEYWVRLFEKEGYVVLDPIRKNIWRNDNVEFWYIQNILMFIQQNYLESNLVLRKEFESTNRHLLSIVHPKLFLEVRQKYKIHREKAEYYIAEAEKYKAETQAHKEKAEYYIAEAEKYKAETRAYKEKAEDYVAEVERYKAKAEPRNMSLKEVVKALPTVVVSTIRRRGEKLFSRT